MFQPLGILEPLISIDGNAGAQGLREDKHVAHHRRVRQYVLLWPGHDVDDDEDEDDVGCKDTYIPLIHFFLIRDLKKNEKKPAN